MQEDINKRKISRKEGEEGRKEEREKERKRLPVRMVDTEARQKNRYVLKFLEKKTKAMKQTHI